MGGQAANFVARRALELERRLAESLAVEFLFTSASARRWTRKSVEKCTRGASKKNGSITGGGTAP